MPIPSTREDPLDLVSFEVFNTGYEVNSGEHRLSWTNDSGRTLRVHAGHVCILWVEG